MSKTSKHLDSVGETYLEHLRHALGFGTRLVLAGLACLIHGILPGVFATTGSHTVRELHEGMVVNRARKRPPGIGIDVVA